MAKKLIKKIESPGGKTSIKVYYDSDYGEYSARLYRSGKLYEPADAFDSDKESILGTAEAMFKREIGMPRAARSINPRSRDNAFDNFMRAENPRKRKAINAKSQITKAPPTKRLKKRRAKNTEPGYFPNPTTKEILNSHKYADAVHGEAIRLLEQLEKTLNSSKFPDLTKQAAVSYAQGFIAGGRFSNALTVTEARQLGVRLSELLK